MRKRFLNLIITLIILSLLGITGLQYFWIRNAYQIKEAQFGRSVRESLDRVVSQLETREKVVFLSSDFLADSVNKIVKSMEADQQQAAVIDTDREQLELEVNVHNLPPPPPPPDMFEFRINMNGETQVYLVPAPDERAFEEQQRAMREWEVFDDASRHYERLALKNGRDDKIRGKVEANIRSFRKKADKITDIVQKMTYEIEELSKPIEQRIDKETLKDLLKTSFADKGINLPFEFAIISPFDSTRLVPVKSQFFTPNQLNSPFRVTLFPNDVFQKPHYLAVFFHGEKTHILKSFALILSVSLFFTLVIIATSVMSILFMIRQKKISDIKTDFINNMTHEFKTPIATISIAADSINNPRVIDEPEKIRGYTRIIKEENQRMNTRVEQVLQMALIDSHDFMLKPEEIDANELVHKAADQFRLIIARREGILNVNLEATQSLVEADADHLRNVVLNLLDNANKYSPGQPEIMLHAFNRQGKYVISVEDKGIGMSPETRRKVFDKFYRYSTGNIHNVKGFGLGLSYVRAIVIAHKGEIRVFSEPGKGSRFEIILPVIPVDDFNNEEENGEKDPHIAG